MHTIDRTIPMTDLTVSHQYNGSIVPQRIRDNYVDVTALAQGGGKKLSHYLGLKGSKTYIEALSSDAGIPASELIQVNAHHR